MPLTICTEAYSGKRQPPGVWLRTDDDDVAPESTSALVISFLSVSPQQLVRRGNTLSQSLEQPYAGFFSLSESHFSFL